MISNTHLFARYHARLAVRDRILGGIPTTDEVGRIAEKLPITAPVEDRQKLAEDKILESTCTFMYDDERQMYYLRNANLVSMLREAADVLQLNYSAKQLLQHGVTVKPERIFLASEITDSLRRPVHVEVRGIKHSTVKVNTWIGKPDISFDVWIGKGRGKTRRTKGEMEHTADSRITMDDLRDLLLVSCEVGLGACRAQQWGKFDLIEFGELS